jgi:hypothetical protein
MSDKKRPDYAVLASRDSADPEAGLTELGVAFESESRTTGKRYIQVLLSARPWGAWDGKLQLHPITPR